MEHNNYINSRQIKNQSSIEIKKNSIIYFFLLGTLIISILFLLYLIEKIIFIILTILSYTILISIPIQIFLHLLLIRYLVIQVAFAGQNIFVSNSIFKNLGRNQADPVNKALKSLHDSLTILVNRMNFINIKELSEVRKQIGNIQTIINYIIDIFNRIKNRFNKLRNEQEIFNNNILSLNECINNSTFINCINNAIDTIQKYEKESLSDIPEEEKNKIISEISNNNSNIQKILMNCHKLIEQIDDYIGENYHWSSLRYISNFFKNKLFASIEQLHCELSNYYNIEEKILITKDNRKLEYIVIRCNHESPSKKLMIICGPNGVPFQIFSRNFRFESYLESNMDVLCWNYRGYGFSKGRPSYSKLRSDVLELFDEIKKNYNYEKFAVHGISIGGIPCCHLASNRKDIELMICDRNFGRLDNITQSFPCGKFLFFMYKFLLFESTDNVDNYLNVKCFKIILNDPKDTIVLDTCSLKTLVSKKLCEKYFDCYHEDNNSNNNSIIGTTSNQINELESLSKKNLNNNQNIPLATLDDKITNNFNNKNSKILIKKTVLDKIFNSVEEKNKFVKLLINISNILKNDTLEVKSNNNFFTNIINKFKNQTVQYSNLNEEELQNTIGIFDFVKSHISDIFDTIESSGDTLLSLFSFKRDYTKTIFIDNFFNNMFIWGSTEFYNTNKYYKYSTKNIKKIFEESMELFEKFWNLHEITNYKELTLLKDIDKIYKYFIQIKNNLQYVGLNTKDGFIKLINEELIDDNNNDYEQCLIKLNIGNFIPLHCGHNGALSIEEAELLERYLKKSSFVNDKIEDNIKVDKSNNDEDNDDINTCSVGSDKNINNLI